jgi:methyltransferase (TIGR00027 family)
MKSDEPSRMAMKVAGQRAAHQLLDHGAILDDPYAVRILGEHEDKLLQAHNNPLMSLGRLFTAARSRIAEDALSKAVERGVGQVVILGAGLDTFALRNPHGARISIFEVDHPATQAWKRQRLVGAEIAPPPWLTFVPVDFEQEDLRQKLSSAGFQGSLAAFFTWLGVVPYLTRDAIDDTLSYIASIPNSEVVFDYAEPPETWTEDVKAYATARTAQLEKINEQWVSRFDPAGVAALLRSHGFDDMEDISFQQVVSRFGREVQGLATGQIGVHVVHAKH